MQIQDRLARKSHIRKRQEVLQSPLSVHPLIFQEVEVEQVEPEPKKKSLDDGEDDAFEKEGDRRRP